MNKIKKVIFVTGATCSSVGKGIVLASLGKLLDSMGFSIKILKIDPYLNQDAGTMNPSEHGEVWVTKDGKETDVDGGTYFRFINNIEDKTHLVTAGNILQNVFNKERAGFYQGETIRFNPHMLNEINDIIIENTDNVDFVLVEIGGTIGETELLPFLDIIKKLQNTDGYHVFHTNVAMAINLPHNNEIKLKPIEIFYNDLPYGIKVDLQFIRTNTPLNEKQIQKIRNYSFVKNILSLENFSSIYEVPGQLQNKKIPEIILEHFNIKDVNPAEINLGDFNKILTVKNNPNAKVLKCTIIGKYQRNIDNYKSIDEALLHGASHLGVKVTVDLFDLKSDSKELLKYDLVVVSGGFGVNLTEEMMGHIRFLRQNNIPTLLICFGLQLALIDIAKNLLKISDATSLEFHESGTHIICLVDEKHNPKSHNFGGTLRVGIFPLELNSNSIVYKTYEKYNRVNKQIIKEKFRHRYWINKNYRQHFEKCGVNFSFTDMNKNGDLFGFELDAHIHKYFVGVQFHPELTSSITNPHPLFLELINKSIN
jgi:CTP synthase